MDLHCAPDIGEAVADDRDDGGEVHIRRELRPGVREEGIAHSAKGASRRHGVDYDLPTDQAAGRTHRDGPYEEGRRVEVGLDTSVEMAYFDGRLDTCLDGGR